MKTTGNKVFDKAIKDAFEATHCMDLCNGDLLDYLQIIRQSLDQRENECAIMSRRLKAIKRAVAKI